MRRSSTARRSASFPRMTWSGGGRCAGGWHWQAPRRCTSRTSDRGEVCRGDVSGDLVDGVDPVPAQVAGVRPNGLLVRRLVDAIGTDLALVVDDDVAVLPHDLFVLLLDELARTAAYLRHVRFSAVEAAHDHVLGHVG